MDSKINIRLDGTLKMETEAVLSKLGMTTAEAVRMTFRQIVMQQGLPFDVRIPNGDTVAALEEDVSDQEPMSFAEFQKELSSYK